MISTLYPIADTSLRSDAPTDTMAPELDAAVAAWPTLPEPIRAGIVAMISAIVGTNVNVELG